MQNHVKRKHQIEVQAHFKDGTVVHIKYASDGTFPCPCGNRRFSYPLSLRTHAKKCIGRAVMMTTKENNISMIEIRSEEKVTVGFMPMELEGEAQYCYTI